VNSIKARISGLAKGGAGAAKQPPVPKGGQQVGQNNNDQI